MAEIVALPGVTAPDQPTGEQPVPGVIKELELLLAEARSGKLQAFAAATVRVGDEAGSLWERPESGAHGHALSAAISSLWFRYQASRVEAGRPVVRGPD